MKRCYICSTVLTELNTYHSGSFMCINCVTDMEKENKKLEKEINETKKRRSKVKSS